MQAHLVSENYSETLQIELQRKLGRHRGYYDLYLASIKIAV